MTLNGCGCCEIYRRYVDDEIPARKYLVDVRDNEYSWPRVK